MNEEEEEEEERGGGVYDNAFESDDGKKATTIRMPLMIPS